MAPVSGSSRYAAEPNRGVLDSAAARRRSRSTCGCSTGGANSTWSLCAPSSSSPPSIRLWRCCLAVKGSGLSSSPICRAGSLAASYCTVEAMLHRASLRFRTADVKPEVTAFLSQDIVAPMMLCPLPCPCVKPRAWDSRGACTSVTPGAMEGCSDDATAS